MAARATAAKRKRAEELRNPPDLHSFNQNNAQTRCVRLWGILDRIDARITHELNKGRVEAATKLANLARIVRGQVDGSPAPTNGHKKPAPASPPPDPLA